MEVQKSEGREKVAEKVFEEMMAKNILHLMKNIKLHILEVQWTPSRISSSRHIVVKLESQKKKILKAFREVTYFVHGILNKINSWFLRRNQWSEGSEMTYSNCWKQLSTKNFISNKIVFQK